MAGAVGAAALLIPPQDAAAAADAVERVCSDPQLAERLSAAGRDRVRPHTLESEARGAVDFLGRAFTERRSATSAARSESSPSAQTT